MSGIEGVGDVPRKVEEEKDLVIERGEERSFEIASVEPTPAQEVSEERVANVEDSQERAPGTGMMLTEKTKEMFEGLTEGTKNIVSKMYEGSSLQEYANRAKTFVPMYIADRFSLPFQETLEMWNVGRAANAKGDMERNADSTHFWQRKLEEGDIDENTREIYQDRAEKYQKRADFDAERHERYVEKVEGFKSVREERAHEMSDRVESHLAPHEEKLQQLQENIKDLDTQVVGFEKRKESFERQLEDVKARILSDRGMIRGFLESRWGTSVRELEKEITYIADEIDEVKDHIGDLGGQWHTIDSRAQYWRDLKTKFEEHQLNPGRVKYPETSTEATDQEVEQNIYEGVGLVSEKISDDVLAQMQRILNNVKIRGGEVNQTSSAEIKEVLGKIGEKLETGGSIDHEKALRAMRAILTKNGWFID
jgi:prefoldin subunit 5